MSPYQPDRGHFIWINRDPHAGTEQGGKRPALVLSPLKFNIATGLIIACPITSQVKGGSFEVPLPPGMTIAGVVLSDHVKSFDWIARNAEYAGIASVQLMQAVAGRVCAIIS